MTDRGSNTGGGRSPEAGHQQDAASAAAPTGRGRDSDTTLFGIVAHELRSPIAAILGYEELLAEGLLGTIDDRAREALARIRSSARQLLTLTEGMQELSGRESAAPHPEDVDHAELLRASLGRAASEAQARRVTLDLSRVQGVAVPGRTDPQALEHVLDAALGAALKTSTGRNLTPALEGDETAVTYWIRNTGMDATTLERIDSGAALRMRIASGMARRLGGDIRLIEEEDGTTVAITIPAVP
ncbi:MAG TPA: HAMP domain-containing sensor histidine kinase [Longimicrobiales bacterium]|nr:HAMP domain-containing sensor histidine kinase [Longimicrobiales bacterium]